MRSLTATRSDESGRPRGLSHLIFHWCDRALLAPVDGRRGLDVSVAIGGSALQQLHRRVIVVACEREGSGKPAQHCQEVSPRAPDSPLSIVPSSVHLCRICASRQRAPQCPVALRAGEVAQCFHSPLSRLPSLCFLNSSCVRSAKALAESCAGERGRQRLSSRRHARC